MSLNIDALRRQFPILSRKIGKHTLVYLDNAATTQKPERVLQIETDYYRSINSNIHRGVYHISQDATARFEAAREKVRQFLGAAEAREIIFTRGTTESVNLLAHSFSQAFLKPGDEILISGMEHHSNIVPWQMACERHQAKLKVLPLHPDGNLQLDALDAMLSPRTRLLALTHISNVCGIVNPVKEIIARAKAKGIPVFLDGAQAAPHLKVDVQDLDCDFYAFSGHKMYAPMGIGILYGKATQLETMPPWQGGGEMIAEVRFDQTTYNEIPYKFEAGTPAVAQVLGLAEAIDFLMECGMDEIHQREQMLLEYARKELRKIPGIRFYGDHPGNASVLSFLVGEIHPYDLGTLLDHFGIAIRTGHHCAQPLMDFWEIPGTMRMSLAFYNTTQEIDIFATSLRKAIAMLQ
jgi:cysteine desulfurase/selenocysteine lyase